MAEKLKHFWTEFLPSERVLKNMKLWTHILNFFQFFPPSLSLSEAETTFNQLSNAKSLENICCNRSSGESLLLQIIFGFRGRSATHPRQLVSFHWNIGKLGEEGWPELRLESGDLTIFSSSFSSLNLLSSPLLGGTSQEMSLQGK